MLASRDREQDTKGEFVMGENRIVQQLRGVAAKLTGDFELQKDLMQEMMVHLIRVQSELPDYTLSWHIKSCEFHARNYLKHGRSIDSPKRCHNLVPLAFDGGDGSGEAEVSMEAIDPLDLHRELIAQDIIDLVVARLSETQQQILFLLMNGLGVREIARELGVSHPAVVKQRKKIARITEGFLSDGEPQLAQLCSAA
jgi:RNA polymerase sigma factor (sigma-70 family)